jgi:hypothetical protein
METLLIVWRLLVLAGILVFPQLLGILLYFRLSRVPRWVAAIAAALAPAVFFFWFTRLLMIAEFQRANPSGHATCGMPAMAAAFLLLAGTAVQLIVGVFTQSILAIERRSRKLPTC